MRKQFNWLEVAVAAALGFWFCAVLIWMWPTGPHHPADHSTVDQPRYHEIPKTIGEWFSAVLHNTGDDPVALYTLVLVIFTGLLGFATFRLWFSTKDLVDGAADTAKRQLRAYVTVESVTTDVFKVGQPVIATITLVNSGQTPAHNAVMIATFTHVHIPPGTVDHSPVEGPPSRAVIGPRATIAQRHVADRGPGGIETRLADSDVELLKSGRLAFVLFGHVKYEDIYGNRRTTTFKFQTNIESIRRGMYVLTASPEGNQAT